MSLKRQMNNSQLLDALDCVDERYVAELVTSMKLPKDKTANPNAKQNWFRSFKYAAAVAACALLLSAIIPIMGMIVGRVEIGSSATNPAGTPTAENLETEAPETEAPETEQIIQSNDLMIKYGWSPKSITNAEADEIIEAYLANDTDPNKLAYTYSVTCYSKYSTNSSAPIYAVMINSDRWTYKQEERVEKVYYSTALHDNLHFDFIFPTEQPLLIYTAGKFYTLNEAMEQSVIDKTQLLKIRWPDRNGGGFLRFVYPIYLSADELYQIANSNPDTNGRWSFRCYGKFDCKYVIFADKSYKVYEPKMTADVVCGLTFIYPNENKLQVCANGTFYSLGDAYAKNILSEAEIREVYNIYTMESKIESEFLAKYGHEFPDMVAEDKGIFVKFEGIYDDVYVAVIASTSWDNTKSPSETVGGITFTWDQWYDIHVYYHGDFLTLTEAFNRGLLTTAQLEEVYESYVTSFTAMFGDPNVFNG